MFSLPRSPVSAQSSDIVEVGTAGVVWIAGTHAPGAPLILHPNFILTGDTTAASIEAIRQIAAASGAAVKRQDTILVCRRRVCHLPDEIALLILGKPRIYGRHAEVLMELWRNVETARFKGTGASTIQIRLFLRREVQSWVIRRAEIQDSR